MSLESNKKLIHDFFGYFIRKDMSGAMALLTDDATWWIGGKPEIFPVAGLKSKAEIHQILDGLVGTSKNGVSLESKGMTAEGDKVACEAVSYGELANGRIYNNEYHFLFTVRDGKIASVKEYLDTMHTADVMKP